MKFIISTVLVTISTFSCAQETPKVKHVKKQAKADLSKVKVVNAEDPICKMKTAEYLKDTAMYKKKVYGFCNESCKKEFKKNPKKYAK